MDNAGKTSLLETMTNGYPNETAPTRGYHTSEFTYNGMEFNIFDIGGQHSLRPYWKNYYDKVAGIVWVIDSTDRRRMFETGLELATILQDPQLSGVPLLIMANKQDLVTAMKADEITEELNLYSIRDRTWQIQASSALEDFGIDEGMRFMTTQLSPPTKEQIANKKAQEALLKKEAKEQEKEKSLAKKKAKKAEKEERKKSIKEGEQEEEKDEDDENGKKLTGKEAKKAKKKAEKEAKKQAKKNKKNKGKDNKESEGKKTKDENSE